MSILLTLSASLIMIGIGVILLALQGDGPVSPLHLPRPKFGIPVFSFVLIFAGVLTLIGIIAHVVINR